MPDPADSTPSGPQLWRRKKIAFVFLGPPVALVVAVLVFLLTSDEELESFPELATTPQAMTGPEVNGFAFLLGRWPRGADIAYKFRREWADFERGTAPWQDEFADIFNPKGQNFGAELDEALSRPVWQDPGELILGREQAAIPGFWEDDVLRPLKAEVWRQARAADLKPAISLIWNVRRLARRQIQGSGDIRAVSYGLRWADSFSEFTCEVVETFRPGEEFLSKLAEAHAEDLITPEDLFEPVLGSTPLFARQFRDEEQMGRISLPARALLLKRNKTINLYNRELLKLMHSGLDTKPVGTSYGKDSFSAPEWQRSPTTFSNLAGIWIVRGALRFDGAYLSDAARKQLFQTRALRIWLAIRRWELCNPGKKLGALSELPRNLLSTIPLDPWNGQPLTWDPSTERIEGVGEDWKPGTALFRAARWFDLDWETAALRLHRPSVISKAAASGTASP